MWGTDGPDGEDPWLLVVTEHSSPATRRLAESVMDLQGSQPSGRREFRGQVKAEPLHSQVTVPSWGPSASWATTAESHLSLLA